MTDLEWHQILRCPETMQTLRRADSSVVKQINDGIAARTLRERGGNVVAELIDGGLIREDGQFLYPVRRDIPVLLIESALPLPP